MSPYVHCNINYNSQDMEATYMSIERRMDKDTMEYFLAIKMNEIIPFATTWMDLQFIITKRNEPKTNNPI